MALLLSFFALLLTVSSTLSDDSCPTLDEFLSLSPYLAEFNPHLYTGIWYELAFYDYTQFSHACGCTHLNWTLSTINDTQYLDDFITTCPLKPASLRKNYTVHMSGTINSGQYPFFIPETGFHIQFNNTVVYYRQSTENDGLYDRAIQYQCKIDKTGKRIFTGINFLFRTHFNSDDERQRAIEEMTHAAAQAGVEQQYLQELKIVQWLEC